MVPGAALPWRTHSSIGKGVYINTGDAAWKKLMVRPTGVGRRLAWESRDKRVQLRQGQELRPAGLGCRHGSNGGRLCRGLGAGPWRVGMIVIDGGAETPLQEVMIAAVNKEKGVGVVNPFWN